MHKLLALQILFSCSVFFLLVGMSAYGVLVVLAFVAKEKKSVLLRCCVIDTTDESQKLNGIIIQGSYFY